MRRFGFVAAAMLSLLSVLSCQRDPIYDAASKYRFEFDIDDDVLFCNAVKPELIQVIFYDPQTGKKLDETYMSPEGGYLYSFQTGCYDIVAFTLGAERTDITYTKDLNLLTAETKVIQSSPATVINAPDHVFAGVVRQASIPCLSEADPQFVLTIPLKSVCDSWKVEVRGVKGLQYASSASLYLGNQGKEILLKEWKTNGNCTIKATGKVDVERGVIEIPFCTFAMGKDGQVTARLLVEGQDRKVRSGEFDVTSQVRDSTNSSHIITVDFPIELQPMTQGGLDPSADEWDENREFIDIK